MDKKSIETKFNKLATKWKEETCFVSNAREIISNKNYEKIIKMGIDVVPIILQKLKTGTDHWFFALMEITGENPVSEEFCGNLDKMAKEWIEWGIEKGYIEK